MHTKELTGYPSIDKPWLKYYSEEAINAPLPECTIYEYLWENNKDHLDDVALIYFGRKITYGELFENIDKAARAFVAIGVKSSDIVILCSINTPETVYMLYALNRLGAIANMVDPRTNIDGLHEYICESAARFVVTIDLAYSAITKAINNTNVERIVIYSAKDSLPCVKKTLYGFKNKSPKINSNSLFYNEFINQGTEHKVKITPYQKDTCCVIAHTGGTTGFPKGVMLSNDNINAVVHGYKYIGVPFKRKDRYFNDLPPFIMYGLSLATHTTLCCGLEVILFPVFDSAGFPKIYKKYHPHHFCALPDHLKYLSQSKITKSIDLSDAVTFGVGGDSLNCELEQSVNSYLHNCGCKYEVLKGYGMTELAATAVTSFSEANDIGSVGIPLVMNSVKIVDTDTSEELGYNKTGEIWISSPSIMLGYYQKPQETAELISVDEYGKRWVHTGDLGYISENGLLFHKGRIRRIYLTTCDGQPAKIFPMLVETAIEHTEGVMSCSVVGRKKYASDYYEAVAFVVCDKPTDESKLIEKMMENCKAEVPSYMIPAEYRIIEKLPLTPIGKVDFIALEKEAEKL